MTVLLAAALPCPAGDVQVPANINYQGKLSDGAGALVANGNYEIKFLVWSDATGGSMIWGKTYPVHIQEGYFNVILGEGGTSVPGARVTDLSRSFDEPSRYLGITVTKDLVGAVTNPQEIAPRQQFLSAPYALRAASSATADNLGGQSPGAYFKSVGGIISGNVAITGALGVGDQFVASKDAAVTGVVRSSGLVVAKGNTEVLRVDPDGFKNGGLVPVGGIIMWSGSAVPSGWALCNGQNNTPDLRGRFVVGSNSTYIAGSSGGAATTALVTANLPAHSHDFIDSYFLDSGNSSWKGGGSPDPNMSTGKSGSKSSTSGNTGSGTAFSILPPYYALAFIMRTQ